MRISFFLLILPSLLAAESPFLHLLKNRSQNNMKKEAQGSLPKGECDCSQFKTDLSLLVWQAEEDGLEFASRNISTAVADISASLSSVNFSWDPGFKVLLGYHFAETDWDLNVRWTWFYSRSHRSLHQDLSSGGDGLFPLWIPPQAAIATPPVYSNAKATLLLLLNSVDIELMGVENVSRAFSLILHGGLKGMVTNQTYRVKYTDGFFDGTNQMLDSDAHAKTKGAGVGIRTGLGSRWLFPHRLSLIADITGALILSDTTTKRVDHSLGESSSVRQEAAIHFHENFWIWRPVLEVKTGIKWDHCFQKRRALKLELAYEIQQYWEQNMLIRYADEAIFYPAFKNQGNLTLQGVSLTVALGF